MRSGLKHFGTYQYFDKGPVETVDLDTLITHLRDIGPDRAVDVLKILVAPGDELEERELLVRHLIMSTDDWDELWERHTDFLENYY